MVFVLRSFAPTHHHNLPNHPLPPTHMSHTHLPKWEFQKQIPKVAKSIQDHPSPIPQSLTIYSPSMPKSCTHVAKFLPKQTRIMSKTQRTQQKHIPSIPIAGPCHFHNVPLQSANPFVSVFSHPLGRFTFPQSPPLALLEGFWATSHFVSACE